jgi:hypothetical protein
VAMTRARAEILCLCGAAPYMAALCFLHANAHKLLAQAAPKTVRSGPFFCAFLTAIAPLISSGLRGPPTGLTDG